MVADESCSPANQPEHDEDGIDVPWESVNPETLRNLIAEFVTREWSDSGHTLDTQISQVLGQLRTGQAKIVFDLNTNTCNIVPVR